MATRFRWLLVSILFTLANSLSAQPILSLDFNERGQDPAATTFPGFNAFVIGSVGSSTAIQTNPSILILGSITVTLSGNGSNPGYDDRLRSTPTNNGDFTQSLLLRDVVYSPDTTANGGLNLLLEGLTPSQVYLVTIWSFDSGSTAGTRVSDWFANGSLVKDNYTFTGSVLPTSDTNYQFSFKATAGADGRLLIQGRRDPATSSAGGVFLNALQMAETTADPPVITMHPSDTDVYAGEAALFSVQVDGTAPFTFQWQKDGWDILDATNRTLVLTNVQAGDAASYSVTVNNAAGIPVSSFPAVLTVIPVTDLRTALLAYWPLDTVTDLTPDLSGNHNDLAAVSLTAGDLVPGQRSPALNFIGTNAMLLREHTNSSGLPAYAHAGYSVCLWVKGSFSNQVDRRVFAETSNTNNNPLASIGTHYQGSNGVVDIYVRTDGNSALLNHRRSTLVAFDDLWHHIAWVDDKGLGRLYVDGVQDTNNFAYTRGLLTPRITSVGGILRSNASNWFTGLIDDVAVWGRALTSAEVQYVMAHGPTLRIPRMTVEGGNVVLNVATPSPTAIHRVEETADLNAPQWTEVSGVTFSPPVDNLITATFPVPAGGQRFYRVAY